ncbi:MAG: ankyrin repeat domain-containing protein [Armatimonadota bacterium]
MQLLVDNGADVALQNDNGETAYQYSHNSCIHHDDMEKLATQLRIDPQSQYPFPYGSFTLSDDEILTFANTQASDGTTMLHHAIVGKDSELVIRLLQAGFDSNHRMKRGDTPLQRAYAVGAPLPFVRSLLEFGAHPELPMGDGGYYYDSDEYTPEVFALLSQHGADFNQRDDEGHSALYHAKDAEMVRIMREFGCAPDIQASSDVSSALFHHASMRRWDIVRHLIEQGVNPRLTDHDGRSLLHYVEGFDPVTAQFLLEAGLDINAQDKYGLTPLMRAGLYGDLACVKWLVNHGADRVFTDPNGWKACDWAGFTYTLSSVIDYLEGNDDEE